MATVKFNEPFKTTTKSFCVGKANKAYTLCYGTDKNSLTPYSETTPANEDLIVNGAVPLTWFMLSGETNTQEIQIIFHN